MFGYDWPRVHAILVSLPVALLSMAVLFELAALIRKSESLRRTGFSLLLVGTVGAGAAVVAGLQAKDAIDHGNAIHHLMEEHEHLALFTLGTFGVVALWRLVRERKMGGMERTVAFVLSLVGLGFLVDTGHHGGKLVFEHAAGVPNTTLRAELVDRDKGHVHTPGEAHEHHHDEADEHDDPAGADSAQAPTHTDGTAPHTHPPGTPPHRD